MPIVEYRPDMTDAEKERWVNRRAPELCTIEQQMRNTGGRFPSRNCPMHGCRDCRCSAWIEIAIEETRAEIRAIFDRHAGRHALADQPGGRHDD